MGVMGVLGAAVVVGVFLVTASPGMASGITVDAALAWLTCLDDAADALYEQPDPALVVASAAFGACDKEERALRGVRTVDTAALDEQKAGKVLGYVLERVLVNRAAKAKVAGPRGVPRYRPL